jgi:hypothetical protein
MEDVLDAISDPEWVSSGYGGALIAWKSTGRKRWLGVFYKQISENDGFVITAFVTRKPKRKPKIWP